MIKVSYFVNQIKGTPVYWKKFQQEVLAKVKLLRYPTFFWSYLMLISDGTEITSKLNSFSLEDVARLDYFEKCNILNWNDVLLARHLLARKLSKWVWWYCSGSVVWGNVSPEQDHSYLYRLVKTFQIHFHSKACCKYKNMKNCFKFSFFFL